MTKLKKHFKFKFTFSNIVFALGIAFILIPSLVIGVILLQSTLQTGSVITGNRFNNDLEPKITNDLMDLTEEAINTLGDVSVNEINLRAATLRITLTIPTGLQEEDKLDIVQATIDKVNGVVPFTEYFSATDTKKMYDLELNFIDQVGDTKTTYIQVVKNAHMDTWSIQDLLVPMNPELAQQLIDELNAKTENTDTESEGN
ncbi:MAG: hypothetical protein Q8T08_09600 [Ignavibacteria bacterium]|nr:hypothetical protein [Ignavibacteria bacterium]